MAVKAPPRKVVLFGNGQVASVAYALLTHDSLHEVVAFTVDAALITQPTMHGLPVVPFEEVERSYPPDEFGMHVAVGFRRVNQLRAEKYCQSREKGYHLLSYVSSRAFTWPDLTIGDNCWIMEGTVVQPYVTIGNDVCVGSASHIGHHSTIGDHCFLAGLVGIPGAVRVGTHCFFGMHSTVRNGVTIADHSVIGAGATVLRSTRMRGMYLGREAKLLPLPSDALPEDFH